MVLSAGEISFAYGERAVLRAVGLSLASGEVVALLGPNGSGKSTLIKALLGHVHASGEIAWAGRELRAWPRRELARTVAYLPQFPTAEVGQTVADVLRLGRAPYWRAFGLEDERDVRVVRDVSAMLGLGDLLDRPLHELSGGQRQRAFIGRCLAQEPAALLLDEPGSALDLRHQVDLCRLLRRLAKERGAAILMASHDLNLAAAYADRLILLDDGAVAAEGPADRVLDVALLSRVYGVEMERVERPGHRRPLVFPRIDATGETGGRAGDKREGTADERR